jgi:hypothetical protein
VLGGLGASVGLPFLDAMVPAQTAWANIAARPKCRLAAIEMVHGAAGSTSLGRERNYWSPAEEGRNFTFTDTLKPLERFRDDLTIVSNTQLRNANSFTPDEDGDMVDHARSSAVFLTGAHPKSTLGADLQAGPSIDQIYAQKVGRETTLASMQLCIEDNRLAGVCAANYSCAYAHTISWASPNQPLPMALAPRDVFNRMFAVRGAHVTFRGGTRSVLDELTGANASLRRELGGSDRHRLADHLDEIRQVERRIQDIERRNADGPSRELLDMPRSVPDSFDEHVALMFDLQLLAFAADLTRVATLKLSIDRSQRIYPASGVDTPFHTLSHHRQIPEKIEEFARLNKYHVGKLAYFLDRMRSVQDGDGSLLDHSIVLYGSPMGDSHVHEHRFLPLLLAGHGNGALKGNLHLRCPDDTPMANVLLTVLHKLGVELDQIGDSTGTLAV